MDIADDVLAAAKELARRDNTTAGHVLSEHARTALTHSARPGGDEAAEFLGIRPLPHRGVVVTNELVNRIREELGE